MSVHILFQSNAMRASCCAIGNGKRLVLEIVSFISYINRTYLGARHCVDETIRKSYVGGSSDTEGTCMQTIFTHID